MGLPKGRTNNANGRPVGSVNKEVSDHRKFIKEFVQEFCNSGKFKKTFAKLEVKDQMKVVLDMMQYVTPKLQAIQNEVSGTVAITWNEVTIYEPEQEAIEGV